MDAELLSNPGFWIAIGLTAAAWAFGSLLKRAAKQGKRAAKEGEGERAS